jgi:REP element-mobilizing transposase RayT
MARPLRQDPDDGWHHVMNRGAGRQPVFRSARDRNTFLALLGDAVARFDVEVHAYCLMGNHFHLLVRCPHGGLSSCMQLMTSQYVRYLNRSVGRDGSLFRGRFHSILLTTPEYVDHVGRYIHRNPLDIRPPVALDQYRWSSFRHFVSGRPAPPWLVLDVLLGYHQSTASFREFVAGGLNEPASAWEWAIDVAIVECGGTVDNHPKLRRVVALALLAGGHGEEPGGIAHWFDFPTRRARSMALLRVRRQLERDPVLPQIVARARRLVA